MTKQDILKLKTSKEVMPTLKTHPKLWDEEVCAYSVKLAQKESLEKYGDENFSPTPLGRKKQN